MVATAKVPRHPTRDVSLLFAGLAAALSLCWLFSCTNTTTTTTKSNNDELPCMMVPYALGLTLTVFSLAALAVASLGLPLNLPFRLLDLLRLLLALKGKARAVNGSAWNVVDEWDRRVKASASDLFIAHVNGESYSFAEANELSLRVSCVLRRTLKVMEGGTVALLVPSCPEYVCLWIGAARCGVTSALINTNLVKASLVHAVVTAVKSNGEGSRVLLVSSAFKDRVEDVREALVGEHGLRIVYYDHEGSGSGPEGFSDMLSAADPNAFRGKSSPSNWKANLFYIYTSGTTGMPKAR